MLTHAEHCYSHKTSIQQSGAHCGLFFSLKGHAPNKAVKYLKKLIRCFFFHTIDWKQLTDFSYLLLFLSVWNHNSPHQIVGQGGFVHLSAHLTNSNSSGVGPFPNGHITLIRWSNVNSELVAGLACLVSVLLFQFYTVQWQLKKGSVGLPLLLELLHWWFCHFVQSLVCS